MEAIMTRRSVRKYTDQPVSDDMVNDLLRAAMAAPSAQNQQPWEFVVVRDRSLLSGLADAQPYAGMVRGAQVAVVICGDLSREKSPGFWVQDCAAATENLLIAARSLGLGAVWTGTYPREERVANVRTVLGLPPHIVPLAVVPVGYPAEHPPPADRYDTRRVHINRW
ncbi:MAG: NADH dehydrogenase [Acidobacteria bacterium RBG_16_64_8]|nr:MAG: NADH dehydrogenase [Acidobacteria bacterium RBG_16_64_8]